MTEDSHPIKAAMWMMGAVASFSAMAIAGREVSVEMNTFELMMYRSLIGFILLQGLILISRRRYEQIKTDRLSLHFQRNIFHFAGQNLWFYGVIVLPLSQLVALEFTNPIWVALLAPIFLGEKMTRIKFFAAILGFIGVLIVARPGVEPLSWGHAAGLGAAIFFAFNTLYTKQISRFESVYSVMFWMTLIQFVFGLILAVPGGIPVPTLTGTIFVSIVAVCGLTAHLCLTTALSLAPATVVAPMDFIRLPVIALLGMAIYQEPILWTVLLGAAIIFAGNFLNIRSEQMRQKRNSAV